MSTLDVRPDSRVEDVRVTDDWLEVFLKDGRKISAPLDWYPRLKSASPEDRANWEPCAAGHGIHWPSIDEDLSVEGLLRGTPA
jgi:hypothetical protein